MRVILTVLIISSVLILCGCSERPQGSPQAFNGRYAAGTCVADVCTWLARIDAKIAQELVLDSLILVELQRRDGR